MIANTIKYPSWEDTSCFVASGASAKERIEIIFKYKGRNFKPFKHVFFCKLNSSIELCYLSGWKSVFRYKCSLISVTNDFEMSISNPKRTVYKAVGTLQNLFGLHERQTKAILLFMECESRGSERLNLHSKKNQSCHRLWVFSQRRGESA